MRKTFVMSTRGSAYMADRIAQQLFGNRLMTDRRTFDGIDGGEKYYRIQFEDESELVGQNVIFVGSTHSDDATLELYRVGCALAGLGTRRRIFMIPFFGYSTMERAVNPGEVVTAKTQTRLFSSIPNSNMGNHFLLLDSHSPGLVHYFEGDCLRKELHAEAHLIRAIDQLGLANFMFASADLGRPRMVQRLAKHYNTDIALISKTRVFDKTKIFAIVGDVRGKVVIIYDDMTRSAKTIRDAANAYMERGAVAVYAVLSHCALNDEAAIGIIEDSPIVKLITTNSHPMSQHPLIQGSQKFVVIDVSDLFAAESYKIIGL